MPKYNRTKTSKQAQQPPESVVAKVVAGSVAGVIGPRLRALRKEKNMSQGDIEKRTGLLRCYSSRVENGHTIPSVQTLEKLAKALEIPVYKLFYAGDEPPAVPVLPPVARERDPFARKLRGLIARISVRDKKLLLHLAQKMARPRPSSPGPASG